MPNRPRSHVLGDEAVDAFKSRFRPWVVRELDRNDYGIDAEVEAFQENGAATGITFKAQIKGTDNSKRKKSHKVQVRLATLNYWQAQAVPVLVFLFDASSGNSFARWAHSYDPVVESRGRGGGKALRKISFSFSPADVVSHESPSRLLDDVRAVRALKQRVSISGLPVRVHVDSRKIGLDDQHEIEGHVAQRLRGSQGLLTPYDEGGGGSHCHVSIDDKRIRFMMPAQLSSLTMYHDCNLTSSRGRRDIAKHVIVAAATELAALNIDVNAIGVLVNVIDEIDLLAYGPYVVLVVVGAYFRQRRVDEALALASDLMLDDREWCTEVAVLIVTSALLGTYGQVSGASLEGLESVVNQVVEREYEKGALRTAAEMSYLQAGLWKARLDADQAINHYRQVVLLDRTFVEQSWFHREFGEAYGLAGHWHMAAAHFARSKECGSHEVDIDYLHVDALLRCGRYREAYDLAQVESADSEPQRDRMQILGFIASWVLGDARVALQPRHQLRPDILDGLLSYETSEQYMRILASTDILDDRVLLAAERAATLQEPWRAFGLSVTNAWLHSNYCSVWMAALLQGLYVGATEELLNVIADHAIIADDGEGEVDVALDEISERLPGELYSAARRIINSRRKFGRSYVRPSVVRFTGPGSEEVVRFES